MNTESVLAERASIDAEVEGKTIVDYLERNVERYGDDPAIHYKDNGDWKALTWKQYQQAIHDAAAGLQSLGVGDGEFVGIMSGNRPEHVIADYASIHAGATGVTIYSTLAANEILCLVGESGSGKSMTASAIMRLLPQGVRVDGGTIDYEGVDLLALDEAQMREVRGARIAMVFQEPMTALNPLRTVGDQIGEMFRIHTKLVKIPQRIMRHGHIPDSMIEEPLRTTQ